MNTKIRRLREPMRINSLEPSLVAVPLFRVHNYVNESDLPTTVYGFVLIKYRNSVVYCRFNHAFVVLCV